ncbi:MAG: DUF2520 domain-containing protein [Bacteroidaceae bacterium]|nr:DUF2520 domain-containing protein [Bacteroidaceae bacterium]
MRIALIGAGRVASCMGPRLRQAGHTVTGVYSRTLANAEQLAKVVGAPAFDCLDSVPEADVYLVMLSDDALLQLAPAIVKGREKALFLHTAGSVPMDLWKEAGAKRYGVLYAMQTFSKGADIDWPEVPVFVEGCNPQELRIVTSLASDLSGKVTELSSEGRKKLHVAAVFTCNFSNHMYAIAEKLLATEGVPFSVMLPLVRETARKVEGMSPEDAQTGPAVRGDRKVMDQHLELLKEYPEYAELYRLISTDINKKI